MNPRTPRPAREPDLEGRYLQSTGGEWSVVGADGWPVPPDEYLEQLRDREADIPAVQSPGLVVIDAEPTSVREIPWHPTDSVREELEK